MAPETPNFEAGFYGLPVPQHAPRVTGREPLEVVASEFLGALRSANRPEIDHYVRQHPELADEIRELFPVLAALEDWKFYRERTSFEHRSIETLTNEIFGNFRIVREVGRGGMGIVFEGQEQTTKRRVAIKVIPFLQSTRLRENFEREARTAARLRHPHIVPVFAFGEQDGLCYYIMRLIEGVGLDWMIRATRGRAGRLAAAHLGPVCRSRRAESSRNGARASPDSDPDGKHERIYDAAPVPRVCRRLATRFVGGNCPDRRPGRARFALRPSAGDVAPRYQAGQSAARCERTDLDHGFRPGTQHRGAGDASIVADGRHFAISRSRTVLRPRRFPQRSFIRSA